MAVRNRNCSPLAQEDSRWPFSAEAQARTRSITRGIYGRQSRIMTGFPPSILVFPSQYHFTSAIQERLHLATPLHNITH